MFKFLNIYWKSSNTQNRLLFLFNIKKIMLIMVDLWVNSVCCKFIFIERKIQPSTLRIINPRQNLSFLSVGMQGFKS